MSEMSKGVAAVLGSAMIWGVSPIFYKALSHVPALDVLAHRMIWSLIFFGGVLAMQGRLHEIRPAFSDKRKALMLVAASVIIMLNWALFIWAVQAGLTTQSSLGYYIYPLLSVLLGFVLFREALTRVQWGAIGLVTFAVLLLTWGVGVLPWVALVLAVSFASYGVVKKQLDLGPVLSVTIEVLLLVPLAVIFLAYRYQAGADIFGGDATSLALLVLSGPMTAFPLVLFGYGTRRMKMASVGLILYVNPTLQFACAVFVFGEPFSGWHLAAFTLIWIALAIYSGAAWRQDKARRTASRQASASGTAV